MSTPPTTAALDTLAEQMLALFDAGVPAVLRNVDLPFTPEEVFDWIRVAHPAQHCKPGVEKIEAVKRSWGLSPEPSRDPNAPDPGRPAEVYRKGAMLLDASPFVPSDETPTFDAWLEHTRERLGDNFGMMAPGLECASWDALHRLRALLGPTLDRTGARSYRYNAFLGDYRRTPFGYHLDPHQECVFQFVLQGNRRGSFWEGLTLGPDDAAWIESPNQLVSPPKRPELDVELSPGDVVFWPGTHLHGFDTTGPSMALSLVIDRNSPRSRAAVIEALETATLGGRAALPAVQDAAEVAPTDVLRRRPHAHLAFEAHDDALIVAVCGRTFDWPDPASQPAAGRLLAHLQACDVTSADTLSREFGDKHLGRDEVLGLTSMLVSLGFLVVSNG